MNRKYTGKSKDVLKILGFLISQYQMKFLFQSFDEHMGFRGPINTYSFYNEHGCFTLYQVAQRGEWGWYKSKTIHANLEDLLEMEIRQSDYIRHRTFFFKKSLRYLGVVIREQIEIGNKFFGITINNKT